MPTGGTLTIAVRLDNQGQGLEIRFCDEGRGMNAADRERYFQPFSGSFDRGTGLGAAIVYRLVEEHGGKIRLDSTPGRGTVVTISLPRRCTGSTKETEPESRMSAAGG
jgi:signal transduction histidine kinase